MNGFSIISLGISFAAGLASFLSPCILPVIPGFLSYLAGTSINDQKISKKEIFLNSLLFVLGFSTVFSIAGVLLHSVLSAAAFDVLAWLSKIAGIIIVFFGIYLTGILNIPFLTRENKIHIKQRFGSTHLNSFVFGAAFAVGWTPCVGPILGSILALAATQPALSFFLLLSYSLGLGIPFLLAGLFVTQTLKILNRFSKALKYVNIILGIILIIIGISILDSKNFFLPF